MPERCPQIVALISSALHVYWLSHCQIFHLCSYGLQNEPVITSVSGACMYEEKYESTGIWYSYEYAVLHTEKR